MITNFLLVLVVNLLNEFLTQHVLFLQPVIFLSQFLADGLRTVFAIAYWRQSVGCNAMFNKVGNNLHAPLKAIIFLNRDLNNTYRKIDNKEEIYIKMLSQIYLPKEKSKREKALKVADTLLKNVNFYEINVNQDIDAAKMTYERIIRNEIK